MRNYHRNTGTPRCALKVDLMKADDSVNWLFLKAVLLEKGFPTGFVNLVMTCYLYKILYLLKW